MTNYHEPSWDMTNRHQDDLNLVKIEVLILAFTGASERKRSYFRLFKALNLVIALGSARDA